MSSRLQAARRRISRVRCQRAAPSMAVAAVRVCPCSGSCLAIGMRRRAGRGNAAVSRRLICAAGARPISGIFSGRH